MNQDNQTTPLWVTDNPLISRLLKRFIDQCDRPSAVRFSVKVNLSKWPELYDFSDNNYQSLWKLIDHTLYRKYQIIEQIQYRPNSTTEQRYDQAIIRFNPHQEELVRSWLMRPRVESYAYRWHLALALYPRFRSTSLAQPIAVKDFQAEQIVSGFIQASELIDVLASEHQVVSIRGLSARCFWGDSKFLDKRRNLIYDVFPKAENVVRDRIIMMSAYAPKRLDSAIFVENFDSFMTLVDALEQTPKKDTTAVIYSAGYRGTADKIRHRRQSQFLHINLVSPEVACQFDDWWYQHSEDSPNCYFWGDLDFEGLNILRSLRKNFPKIQAWRPAYQAIVSYHQQGLGHFADQAGKQGQKMPLPSGCDYGDKVLLPLLQQSKRFIDQEVVDKAQLIKILAD